MTIDNENKTYINITKINFKMLAYSDKQVHSFAWANEKTHLPPFHAKKHVQHTAAAYSMNGQL